MKLFVGVTQLVRTEAGFKPDSLTPEPVIITTAYYACRLYLDIRQPCGSLTEEYGWLELAFSIRSVNPEACAT